MVERIVPDDKIEAISATQLRQLRTERSCSPSGVRFTPESGHSPIYGPSVVPVGVAGNGAGCGGAGCGGVIGDGAGFGVRFFGFALLADFAILIPFFFRAGAPRFAFFDFFATFNIPIKIMPSAMARPPIVLT